MPSAREERKRDEILDRALSLFFERGISSLSMEAIAAGIGVSKVTLYKYFPGKEALGIAAIERRIGLITERMDALEAQPGITYAERFRGFIAALTEVIRPATTVLMKDIWTDARWLWTKVQQLRSERVFPRLAQLIREGRDLGYVRDDLDAYVAGSLIISMAESVGQPGFILDLPIPPGQAIEVVIRVLLGGVLSDEGRRLFDIPRSGSQGPTEGT